MMQFRKLLSLLLVVLMVLGFTACSIDQETVDLAADIAIALLEESEVAPSDSSSIESSQPESIPVGASDVKDATLDEFGAYTTKEDVALFIHTYGRLPMNFMTKAQARELGWEGGGLDDYAYGMCIGGDRFGNYEGLLPDAEGRRWTECDIDTLHADARGPKRIVFSNDGLIFYTGDHYESFELLYGEA